MHDVGAVKDVLQTKNIQIKDAAPTTLAEDLNCLELMEEIVDVMKKKRDVSAKMDFCVIEAPEFV